MDDRLQELKKMLEGSPIQQPLIGSTIRLLEDGYENEYRPFLYNHKFVVKSVNGRIYHVIDDGGNELDVLDKHVELI